MDEPEHPFPVQYPWLVNHSAPSGPVVIPSGSSASGTGYVVITPLVVIRPIALPNKLVNHSAPSGPTVICCGKLMRESAYLVTCPLVVILPIDPRPSVNHSAPSGPTV